MKNPISKDSDIKTLLLSEQFHLDFINKHGFENWKDFVSGDRNVTVPKNDLIAKLFVPHGESKKGIDVHQENIAWNIISGDIEGPATSRSKFVIGEGDSLKEFAEYYPHIIPKKYKAKDIISELGEDYYSDSARESGYEMFPGVEHYENDALWMIERYFRGTNNKDKSTRYRTYLMMGYKGEDSDQAFYNFLILPDNDRELSLSEKENEARIEFYDAIRSALSDAYADGVQYAYKNKLNQAFKDVEFKASHIEFDRSDKWKVWTTLGELINYYISQSINEKGELKYPDVGEDTVIDHFLEVESEASIPDEYPEPDELDEGYAYDNFTDQLPRKFSKQGDILP